MLIWKTLKEYIITINARRKPNQQILGNLEADTIKQGQIKDKIQKEYLRRTRKLIETKFSSRNFFKGINSGAVRYLGPFPKLTRDELKQIHQRTRNLMTTHKALHPRDDVDRLYVSRKEEEEEGRKRRRRTCQHRRQHWQPIQRLENYIRKHKRGLITAIRNNTDNTMDNKITIIRKQKWEDRQLYGRCKRLINNISHYKTRTWQRKGHLKNLSR